MFKFNPCSSMDPTKRKSFLFGAGLAEIAIGLMEMGLARHGSHALIGVGTPFVALGIIFICRARRMPTS